MGEEHIISKEGLEKLKEELNNLTNVKRREIADRIQVAKDMGDLSENAEYSEAKDAQAFNDGRIAELKNIIKNAQVVEGGQLGKIGLGSTVTVKFNQKEKIYTIVSFNEVDPAKGKISNESPIGSALLNKEKGTKVVVELPKGQTEFEILKVK
ncbi:transcription elongation factor GreA [Candidatus Parcubacteria bacterium]|nr:transcription elongation factor GreA [Candidatus Parcubacteria bacterium]